MTVSYHVTSTLPFAWPTAIKFSGSELGYHATHCYKGINGHHNYSENIYSNKCSNFRFLPVYKQRFKLLRPWRFCQKTRFEASRAVFWSLLCYEELKLTIKPFTVHFPGFWSRCKLDISLRSSGTHRKQNLGFKSDTDSGLDFYFLLFLTPSFFAFLNQENDGHLVGFILARKVFMKAFRILGLDERKGRSIVKQEFRCPWLNCAHSGMIERSSLCTS